MDTPETSELRARLHAATERASNYLNSLSKEDRQKACQAAYEAFRERAHEATKQSSERLGALTTEEQNEMAEKPENSGQNGRIAPLSDKSSR